LTLKSSYLDTLSVGKHILKFQYKDNVAAETDFTITTKTDETPAKPSTPNTGETTIKPSTPNTGDTSNTMLCFGLMILSGCLAGYSLKKKKALRS
ncbi:MAG: LPXTG cell wall anchor domain-containing protein, partial [Erysipelotrichaceae bacterium]